MLPLNVALIRGRRLFEGGALSSKYGIYQTAKIVKDFYESDHLG